MIIIKASHIVETRVKSQCNSVGSKKPLVRTNQVDETVKIIILIIISIIIIRIILKIIDITATVAIL